MTTSNAIQNGAKPLPPTVIIIGAGVFGLSTALAIAKRSPSTKIIVIDRLTPPVPDGTSVDTTRCIRADYTDPIYARLAKEAQLKIQQDPGLKPYVFQQGMTFVCDGQPSRFTNIWNTQLEAVKASAAPGAIIEMDTPEAVFRRIHGPNATPPAGTRWSKAYCNLEDAFIDAEASVRVYYERCAATPSIAFKCGTPVDHINIVDGASRGVTLEDGTVLDADTVIVAAGAWANKLVSLGQRVKPTGHEVAWIKVTPDEEARWKNMSITTNLTTGLNLFPPYQGEIKILRRSAGYTNTVTVPDPEHPSKKLQISYPRTKVSNPGDEIPASAEASLRENLREIMPELADRPFDRSRICWLSVTPTSDFLICPHPRVQGVHLAGGGSAHAWKFLPILGDLVVDSMTGTLSDELVTKWSFERSSRGKDENSPRMDGEPEELRDVVRHVVV